MQAQQITGATTNNGREQRQLSMNTVNWENQRGWYLDLSAGSAEGERSVGRPRVVLGSVAFTTLEPQGDECSPGALNRLYLVRL